MTGVDKIKDRILEEARQQAKANTERAEAEAADIMASAKQEAEQKRNSIIEKAQNEAVEVKKRLVAVADLEARKDKLQARQEVVEEAFERALNKLCSMPDKQYQEVLVDMIVKSVEAGNEEIILSEKDKKRMSADFIDIINKKIAGKGIPGSIKLSGKSADISGGFILKSGDVEINNSFGVIFRMKRDELETEVFNILF